MNILKYVGSKGYRNRFSEEYSKEFIGRFEQPEQEYERMYYQSPRREDSEARE